MNKKIYLIVLILGLISSISLVLAEEVTIEEATNSLDPILVLLIILGTILIVIAVSSIISYYSNNHATQEEPTFESSNWRKVRSKIFKSNPHKQFCGVEIEAVNDNSHKGFSKEEQKKYEFYQGKDGSLDGDYTAEFRSSPMQGDRLINNIGKFSNELNKRGWYVNESCGLHIHIETPRDLDTIKKLYIYYNKYEKLFFKMLPPSRRHNTYCEKINDKYSINKFLNAEKLCDFMKLFYESNYYGDKYQEHHFRKRYCWLNLHSIFYRGTLEIRSHAGTINSRKINNWLLIHLSLRNKLDKMTPEQVFNLSEDKETFLSFFNKHLRDYIKERWDKFPNLNEDKFKENRRCANCK